MSFRRILDGVKDALLGKEISGGDQLLINKADRFLIEQDINFPCILTCEDRNGQKVIIVTSGGIPHEVGMLTPNEDGGFTPNISFDVMRKVITSISMAGNFNRAQLGNMFSVI